jgi:WhiB family transcriptional regulator, redox-sensing transcriptional regulator
MALRGLQRGGPDDLWTFRCWGIVSFLGIVSEVKWWQRAACADADTSLFYDGDDAKKENPKRQLAKAFCEMCPVRQECLEEAIQVKEKGIWGGMTTKERRRLVASRKLRATKGRPRRKAYK